MIGNVELLNCSADWIDMDSDEDEEEEEE